jgi:cyclic pyranopterin monophosphate synthase
VRDPGIAGPEGRAGPGAGEKAARMVEVGGKDLTVRQATAECTITMTTEACAALVAGTPKGDPLEAAKVAGLLGAKRTPDLLPFCHPVAVTGASVLLEPDVAAGSIRVEATVKALDRTGVEMEALTAAAVAALSLYDTAKAFDRAAEISGLHLAAKSGGKSGEYRRSTST